jgi:hypothetical protein
MWTMGEAARRAGISKATLSRAIKSGRVSATRNDKGGFDVDPAELFRVYPRNAAMVAANGAMKRDATSAATPDESVALQAEIDALRGQLALMREQRDDLRSQRDSSQRMIETLLRQRDADQLLLADLRPQQQPTKRGWRHWIPFIRSA